MENLGIFGRVSEVSAVAAGEPTDTSELAVLVNGATVFYRRVVGPGADLDYTIPVLSEGDTVVVKMRSAASRTLEDGLGTYLQITASRH